jgi:hypothetical protein
MEAVMKVGGQEGATGLRRRLMKTSKRALTLIEGAMVLGLFAFVVGAAMSGEQWPSGHQWPRRTRQHPAGGAQPVQRSGELRWHQRNRSD